ncbi:MAG: cob(I)yrinic acid a,c-diamide adenosyltransferase [Bacillota bacterium]
MMQRLKQGLIQVYTGTGKGKTTAALGLGFRASGHGFKVKMIQFLKGTGYTGELEAVKNIDDFTITQYGKTCPHVQKIKAGEMDCIACGKCFVDNNQQEHKEFIIAAYQHSKKILQQGEIDIVILDEINNALRYNFLTITEVIELIELKSSKTELILTGRGLPEAILDKADLVTEMKALKHPFEKNISSRRGIEY